jgi:hypothetical protein
MGIHRTIPTCELGNLTTSTQGPGSMGMSEFYGATDDQESIATRFGVVRDPSAPAGSFHGHRYPDMSRLAGITPPR